MNRDLHSAWRTSDGKYTVVIARRCFEEMLRLAQQSRPNEIGTPLVGIYSDDGHRADVTHLAPVSKDSRGGRTTFHRGVAGLQRFFQRLFRSTSGRLHYVGEWHSHPGGAPVPSPTDEANMFDIARDEKAQCPECVLVILGLQDETATLGVYVFSRKRGRIDLIPATEDGANVSSGALSRVPLLHRGRDRRS